MIIYFIPPFMLIMTLLIRKIQENRNGIGINGIRVGGRNYNQIFLKMTILIMTLSVGLRNISVGSDTKTYQWLYFKYGKMTFSEILSNGIKEIGYRTTISFLYKLGCPYEASSLIFSVFIFTALFIFLKKTATKPELSLLIYVCLDFYILDFSMLRQGVAMAIYMLFFAWKQDGDKWDIFKFVLCACCASLWHLPSLVFVPAYILCKLPYRRMYVALMMMCAAGSFLLKDVLVGLVGKVAGRVDDNYKLYDYASGNFFGLKLYILLWAIILIAVLWGNQDCLKRNSQYVYIVLAGLVIFPAVMGGGVILRNIYYYTIFSIVLLPNVLTIAKDRMVKYAGGIAFYGIFVMYYINCVFGNTLSILPYKLWWQ